VDKIKVKNILSGVFILILIYLFATRGDKLGPVISGLSDSAMKSVALLQGREKVAGVTA